MKSNVEKDIQQMVNVYKKVTPTYEEINGVSSFQDLMNMAELWVKNEDNLLADFKRKQYKPLPEKPLPEPGNLSPRQILAEMKQHQRNYQTTNNSLEFNEQFEAFKKAMQGRLIVVKLAIIKLEHFTPFSTS